MSIHRPLQAPFRLFLWLLTAWCSLATSPLLAHHGYSVNYDTGSTITVEGEIEEVLWANPHVRLYITVTNERGDQELWDIETQNLGTLSRAGWTRDTFQVGETIRVTGIPGRDGRHRIAGREFKKADGTVLHVFPQRSSDNE